MITQIMLRTRKIAFFRIKKIRFVTALDLIKSLIQVKYQRLLHTCAPISELPSNLTWSELLTRRLARKLMMAGTHWESLNPPLYILKPSNNIYIFLTPLPIGSFLPFTDNIFRQPKTENSLRCPHEEKNLTTYL